MGAQAQQRLRRVWAFRAAAAAAVTAVHSHMGAQLASCAPALAAAMQARLLWLILHMPLLCASARELSSRVVLCVHDTSACLHSTHALHGNGRRCTIKLHSVSRLPAAWGRNGKSRDALRAVPEHKRHIQRHKLTAKSALLVLQGVHLGMGLRLVLSFCVPA